MRQGPVLFTVICLAVASAALAQDSGEPNPPAPDASAAAPNAPDPGAAAQIVPLEDKRVFGVIPNNRTTEGSLPFEPISVKRKMTIAAKDSFAYPLGLTSSLFAALYQFEDQNPSFGQGMSGYARRLATSYSDQVVGNIMTEGILPSLLHEDPRYFRVGEGSKWSRIRSAVMQIMVTRTDSGGRTFNFSEWGGNAVSAAISNAYYPDSRTATENVEKLLMQCGTDAFSNVLKEFWPDVKRHFERKREARRERELQQLTAPAAVPATASGSGGN
jgi:hypothetical protein